MIVALQTTGFFVTVLAGLRFSSWAERWLASAPRVVEARVPDPVRLATVTLPNPAVRIAQ